VKEPLGVDTDDVPESSATDVEPEAPTVSASASLEKPTIPVPRAPFGTAWNSTKWRPSRDGGEDQREKAEREQTRRRAWTTADGVGEARVA
jgi:hypothetical protein